MLNEQSVCRFKTTASFLSGAICGEMWGAPSKGAISVRVDIRGEIARFSDPKGSTFRDVLLQILMERGGDFQNPRFTADTLVRVERRATDRPGAYRVHVREREAAKITGCEDLIDEESYASDFA